MNHRILITGSSGLVGSALISDFERKGIEIERLDIRASGPNFGDIRDRERVAHAIRHCDGVIQLAAVSRVIWGEQQPELCWSTNVDGLQNILTAATGSTLKPWVIFASSREVYGQAEAFPVIEDCPLKPMNIYGRSKFEGEQLIERARQAGLRACTIRLSNVFGATTDHIDRVVPAFARGAVAGNPLRVDGAGHTFDFTYIDDVARGITRLAELLFTGEAPPPPMHFVSGTPTTLGELAEMVIRIAGSKSLIRYAPPRNFDVERFFGNASRAQNILGWRPQIDLAAGLTRLIGQFSAEARGILTETVSL